MAQAKSGDTVKVHYTGKLTDGTVFDSSAESDPLEFKIGDGQIIPGFEAAVVGMAREEKKTATIPATEAYGPHRDEMVLEVDREQMPSDLEPHVGQQLQMTQGGGEGEPTVVTITGLTDEKVTLDANHPLAGQDLTFDIELVEIC